MSIYYIYITIMNTLHPTYASIRQNNEYRWLQSLREDALQNTMNTIKNNLVVASKRVNKIRTNKQEANPLVGKKSYT